MGTIHARLAHVGIYAHDKPLLERFYTNVLGLMVTDSGAARSGMELTFMSGNPGNHHQLVLVSGRPDTKGFNPIQQISFMVDSLADLREVHGRALEYGAPICGSRRTATPGPATSRTPRAIPSRPTWIRLSTCRSRMASRWT